jgi:dihydrofolate reductase
MTHIVLIAAVARNGVIGHENRLLWHLPQDLQHFRRVTMGQPVLMGRKTWDSLPARFRPLPGRRNIVLTRQAGWQADGAHVAHTLDESIEAAGRAERLFVIGGAELYGAALPRAHTLVLTEIERDFEGDAHFPAWDRAAFRETARERHHADTTGDLDYSFVTYQRIHGD